MTNSPRKGRGRGIQFLRGLLADAPQSCVTWPLFRDVNGYGRIGHEGKAQWAHTLMCKLANGEPPEGHEATHTCGNGKEGCVNPRHLEWGTKTKNQLDRRAHGTATGGFRSLKNRKLTLDDVAVIRSLKGKETQRALALRFGVSDATIRDIYAGRIYDPTSEQCWTPGEDEKLRGLVAQHLTVKEIAPMLGRSWQATHARAYRIRALPRKPCVDAGL